jgi:hypothetical protein
MKKGLSIGVALVLVVVIGFLSYFLISTKNELSSATNTITNKNNEISGLLGNLQETQDKLTQTSDDLVQVTDNLNKVTKEFNIANTELAATHDALSANIIELADITAERLTLKSTIGTLNVNLSTANSKVDSLNNSLDLYQETFGEVFDNMPPIALMYATEPPSWSFKLPTTNTPKRLMHLVENPDAKNPTYDELLKFLKADTTDMNRYLLDYYVCTNFAETVHNNAEASGIRTAMVFIRFTEGPGHAINAFLTTDKGLVYIDCTGTDVQGPGSMDGLVTGLKISSTYNISFLFPSYYFFLPNNLKVTEIEIYW